MINNFQDKQSNRTIKPLLFSIGLLDFMGFTIAATIFPGLLLDPANGLLPTSWGHDLRLILVGVLLSVFPLGQFLSAAVLGAASDKWGRRSILLITLLGTVASCLLTAFAITFEWGVVLFVSRFLLGLCAGNVTVAQASIVDISTEKTKASNISLIQLSLGLAWVFGAPLGGFLSNSTIVNWFSNSTPFWMLFIALTILLILVYFFYPETEQKIHMFKGFQLSYQALSHFNYRDMFFVWMLFIAGWALFLQFLPSFLILKFDYTASSVGPLLAFMGGTFACTQIFIARKILNFMPPETVLKILMLLPGIAALLMAFLNNGLFFHMVAFCFSFGMGFTLPSLLAAISNRADKREQGSVLGMAQSLQALVTIIVTVIGGKLLAINISLSCLIGGGLMFSAWVLFVLYAHQRSLDIQKPALIKG
jgi:DHA1 family tetracycline resistance protein-like MFS transporter